MLSEAGAFQMFNSFVKHDYWNFTNPFKFSKPNYYIKGKFPYNELPNAQLTFACSKSTIETLEKGMKYFQS